MGAVTYFVRMVAKPGQAEAVQELLLTNPRRIEQGEPGNLAFGVHRSTDNPNEFWLYRPGWMRWPCRSMRAATPSSSPRKRYGRWSSPRV